MKIIQLIPTLAYGDAIGNHTIALKSLIEKLGFETGIFAESIVPPLDQKTALTISQMPKLSEDDIILYHLSTGTNLNYKLAEFQCKKIVIYHNVTPPEFFERFSKFYYDINVQAIEGVNFLADKIDYCLTDSHFNRQDLVEKGYQCPIDVVPILIPFHDYNRRPKRKILSKYADDRVNIITTGRIVPNKKIEDVIAAFSHYKKNINERSRLILIGAYKENDLYYKALMRYIEQLELKDVIFTGHVSFEELLAFYRLADIYLCMSEHEGFCVPLIESMFFQIPIIAYDKAAVGETLGGSGILVKDKEPVYIAKLIDYVMRRNDLYQDIVYNQNIRLKDFEHAKIEQQLITYLEKFILREHKK